MSTPLLIVLIVGGVLLLIGIWYIITRNHIIKLSATVDEAFATMDVYLKERTDLIPNVVETVKGYTKHENETLSHIVELRNSVVSCKNTNEKQQKEGELSSAVKSLFALAESYPDLKANTNFQQLQTQLEAVENHIAQARKYYNAIVKTYNYYISAIPSNIVANSMKLTKREMFEITASERANVKVQF